MQDFKPYKYQRRAIDWIIDHPRCALFLDMGLGKTVCTLTAIQRLYDDCEINGVLVIAPKRVAETTWTDEAQKWQHLAGLTVQYVGGNREQRLRALSTPAFVHVIGRDTFTWLMDQYPRQFPFDMVVIDELTSFKTPKSQRFKAFKKLTPRLSRVVGLTGTPAPNGLQDLWAQIYCIDAGQRLLPYVTRYYDAYFTTVTWNNIPIKRVPKKGADAAIKAKLSDICLAMQAGDYLQLPPMNTHDERINLSPPVMKQYKEFERERVLEVVGDDEITDIPGTSAAALMNKLSQYASGAIYDTDGLSHLIHDEKLDALESIIESANGNAVLVFYQYRHDVQRILDRLKGYRVAAYESEQQLRDWNNHKLDVLLAHPASTAFGLNMQQGGHYIVWFGLGWNLELYEQANARLYRQGQQYPVHVYRLICTGTVDELQVAAMRHKSATQQGIMEGLKALAAEHRR